MQNPLKTCPCCSKIDYEVCCKPFIEGNAVAPDAVSLMRSRYTAFVLKRLDYIASTWHPETLPDLGDEPSNWISLEIVGSDLDEDEAEVEFIAKLVFEDKVETLHEISYFMKEGARWLYHSGEFEDEEIKAEKISMKTPCPCGSGEKFKHCHYKP